MALAKGRGVEAHVNGSRKKSFEVHSSRRIPWVDIMGLPVANIHAQEAVEHIVNSAASGRGDGL